MKNLHNKVHYKYIEQSQTNHLTNAKWEKYKAIDVFNPNSGIEPDPHCSAENSYIGLAVSKWTMLAQNKIQQVPRWFDGLQQSMTPIMNSQNYKCSSHHKLFRQRYHIGL